MQITQHACGYNILCMHQMGLDRIVCGLERYVKVAMSVRGSCMNGGLFALLINLSDRH